MDALLGATVLDAATETLVSSAPRTCPTCWFTIGCRTRCPIAPTGPAILTSASRPSRCPRPPRKRERRRHVHKRADARALRAHRGELGRALLEPLEVHRHLEAAEAERDLDLRRPVRSSWISKLSTPGMSFAISAGSLMTAPDRLARRRERFRPGDDHFDVHRDVRARRLRVLEHRPHPMRRVAARVHDRLPG